MVESRGRRSLRQSDFIFVESEKMSRLLRFVFV
jgi:hypothetical protein